MWPEESGTGLFVRPTLMQDAATKVAETDPNIAQGDEVDARDDLRENFFGTLDIFVKRHDAAETADWFKQYHLTAGQAGVVIDPDKYDSQSLLDKAKQTLASNWAEQGYVPDVPYDIYVTANNPHTVSGSAPANLQALKALKTQSTDIYRYYYSHEPDIDDPAYQTNCMYTDQKNFLMDGKIEGWTIDPSKAEQVFDVDMNRAAAKIIMTVKFSNQKSLALVAEPTTENPNPEPEKDEQGRIVFGTIKEYMAYVGRTAGEPRWKPVNFCLTGSDIAYDSDTTPATQSLYTYGSNFMPFKEGDSTDNTDNTFAFVTYTYPVDWSEDATRIPYVLLSVFYVRNSDGDQLRSYYRIPVCDERQVTSLDRNHVYLVDVEIASLGSSNESFEAQDEELRIEYHVIPWTETNMTQEATTVKITDTKYLTILPTEYTLTGDATQEVEMLWYASVSTDDNRIVDIDPSTLTVSYVNYQGTTVDIRGTVTKQVKNDQGNLVTATDGNTDGKRDIVITSTAPTTGANGEKVKITLTPNGLIKVESDALDSRAIKDISFKVYLKNATGVDQVTIKIRHFPLDNIQSFTGSWSSRWDGVKEITEYTTNLSVAQGWGSYTTQTNPSVSYSDYISYTGAKTDNSATTTLSNQNIATIFGVTNNNQRNQNAYATGANSLETAKYYNGSYYWVTRTGNYSYTYTYHVASEFHLTGTVYGHTTQVTTPSTGNWVEWGVKNGTVSDGLFTAKVYYSNYCYGISNYNTRGSRYDNLKNNHMYVLQITSTSDKYVLGKPVLDANYQSNDKVVSPAFMIASQLGAVSTTNSGTTAATHCGTYMEVGEDGKRYVGWRLPTKQEIEVIISYQDGTYTGKVTMETVLGGQYYWSLEGTTAYVANGSGGSTTTGYVRCVRDLTLEEVNQLNQTSN